ncbi:hemolysin family protein [Mobilicoccus caccae]|uniref:Membrane protein n=1 Tax=Mobilicoccus caccae TaxID=1859295 RepID=A0ABQ6INM8_9MICO|nr:membrane protein [Mobilicoccus caccae]
MTPVVSLLVGVVVVLLITAATGYFVAQEFAYMAVDRSRLASRARQGDAAAERTLAITKRTSFMLSGAQLGITVTGLLVGYVAEPLIGQAFAQLAGGSMSTALAVTLGGVLALAFSTLVQMLFGELVPKNYAIAEADRVARWLSRSTRIYLAVLGPVIWVFDKAAEGFLRLLRIEPVHDVEHAATARDLEHVVAESRASGDLSPELSTLLDRILDFPERPVEHAMVPRSRVDTLRDTLTVAEVRHEMATGHTRYPVLNEDEDVIGVVDLAAVLDEPADSLTPVTQILEPALILTPFMTLPDALHRLQENDQELACVIDEYGGFAGILTVEDLAEEVVGELTDEHDPDEPDYEPRPDDGVWVMAGDVHVDEVERALDVDLPEGDYETVSGLALDTHGGLPGEGRPSRWSCRWTLPTSCSTRRPTRACSTSRCSTWTTTCPPGSA